MKLGICKESARASFFFLYEFISSQYIWQRQKREVDDKGSLNDFKKKKNQPTHPDQIWRIGYSNTERNKRYRYGYL